MTKPASSRTKPAATGRLTYRGVTLQKPATRSRFSIAEIKTAIEHAVAKNADKLAKPS